jgi:hypothetical protein
MSSPIIIIKRGKHQVADGPEIEVVIAAHKVNGDLQHEGWIAYAEDDQVNPVGRAYQRRTPSMGWVAVRGKLGSRPATAVSDHLTLTEALQAIADFTAEQRAPKPPEPPTREAIEQAER